jgi:acetyl-CoA C-acetyltransferase
MTEFDASAPVIVGVGEASRKTVSGEWPSPTQFAGAAIMAALADCGMGSAMGAAIDCVATTRTFEDSGVSFGTGSPDNVPEAYAKAGGITAKRYIYADIGGQSSQALVTQIACVLKRGEIRAAIIAGAEANGTAKRARREGVALNWRISSDTPFEDQRSDFPILSRAEIRNGIVSMPLAYSLIETARMMDAGLGRTAYLDSMTRLWSAFSGKSLTRDHAQFARVWSAAALNEEGDGNYPLTDIYRRWMVAQDAVDMGAAIVMTTAGAALDWGIAPDKMVWLAGAANASEPPLSERRTIAGSDALDFAIAAALEQAGVVARDLGPVDIYSCFPCAVSAAIDAMNDPARALGDYTLTGGLSFFGGPGNGYSLHGLVAMVQALRSDGTRPAMVMANGGVMSKQAVGIYTATQPSNPWAGEAATGYVPTPLERDDAPRGKAKVLSAVRPVSKDGMGDATLVLEMADGRRALAVMQGGEPDVTGCVVDVTPGEKRHIAMLA